MRRMAMMNRPLILAGGRLFVFAVSIPAVETIHG